MSDDETIEKLTTATNNLRKHNDILLKTQNQINDLFEYRYSSCSVDEIKKTVDRIFENQLIEFRKIK